MIKRIFTSFCMAVFLSGCASLIGDSSETVSFQTNEEYAELEIRSSRNELIYSGEAPVTLTLEKKCGYFCGEKYYVRATKDGYEPVVEIVDTVANKKYLIGNIFTYFIGYFIDPTSGAMWDFDKNSVTLNLKEISY
ncbi:MAG: hypothetical protein J5716_00875 [Alphaproteobacteria bacterium]|nr:hypothetical protein [Alphaproteobacteria bacterium]